VVADELKHRGKVEPVNYESVSVLFTDFKGFTELSEQLTPKQLVDELDYCFSYFDEVIEKHNLEKLKTIGDSYMAVGGIPNVNSTHAIDAVLAALEIQAFIEQRKEQHMRNNTPYWEMRIGIHSGSLIAGVIGQKKFAYDVWGDTVNTASRMESSGVPGKINISQSTFELIKDFFVCNYRGKLPAKNKGDLDMYLVKGIKQGFSPELLSILNKNKLQYLDLAIQSAQCCQEKKRHSILTM
jgi:class 3 adenylate cyclase